MGVKRERRTNLNECYKFVRTCKGCSKDYGSDFVKEVMSNYCPECLCSSNKVNEGHYGGLRRYARLFRGKGGNPRPSQSNRVKGVCFKQNGRI